MRGFVMGGVGRRILVFYPRVGAVVADAGGPLVDLGGGSATNQWSPLVALRTGFAALPFRHLTDVIDSAIF